MNKCLGSIIIVIGLAIPVSSTLADPSNSHAADSCAKHHSNWSRHETSGFSMPSERIEARLAYLKTALKITDAQNPQWETFADIERKQAQADDKMIQELHAKTKQCESPSGGEYGQGQLSAIDRMEHQEKRLNDAAKRLDAKIAAFKPLYAVLSKEQRYIANEVLDNRHRCWGRGKRESEHASAREMLLMDLHRLVQI